MITQTQQGEQQDQKIMFSFFKEHGFLLVKNMFDREMILSIRKQICDLLASENYVTSKNPLSAISTGKVYKINSPEFYRITQKALEVRLLHVLAYDRVLLDFLEDLLGTPIFAHPNKMFRMAFPFQLNPTEVTPPHQDIYYVKGEKDTFTVWTPLGTYGPNDGALMVLDKSHKEGLYPIRGEQEKHYRCAAANVALDNPSWCRFNYKIGDCLIMHSLTIHASERNESNALRMSVDCRFSARNGTINAEQLKPPYHPHIKEWKEIMKGWESPWPLQDIPQELQVVPKETPLEISLQQSSRFI